MKTGLLTSSSFFGKYVPNENVSELSSNRFSSINLKQNFIHERPFINCKFDIPGNRLYLLDTNGILIHLNLNDNSFSTLKGQKIQSYTIDGNNSLSILFINQKSQLHRVSFDNKNSNKITNLNMNKIIAFQRNYLRDMILALDYKLLFLCDVHKSGPLKIKSLKAKGSQIFTNACFSSNNRFIILAIKNTVIKIVQIMDLKTIHQIRLPFMVQNLKIQVSYDSKRIAIYGDCNIIFFINSLQNETYSYELIQIPFAKSICQFKYTCQNDILFLANDQVLYGISSDELDKAVPLFNEQYQMRMMAFDISLDCSKIAIVSNRTVMQLKLQNGLSNKIEQKSTFKQLQHRKNGFDITKQINQPIIEDSQEHVEDGDLIRKPIQYNDEDSQQEQGQKENKQQLQVQGLSKTKFSGYKQQCGSLHAVVADLKNVTSELKAQINSILNNLLENDPHKREIVGAKAQIIVNTLSKLLRDSKLSPDKCYTVMNFVIQSLLREKQRIEHFAIILCPQIKAIIQRKFNVNFVNFIEQQILSLYSKYFQDRQWREAINWILSPGVNQKSENLPMLMICILHEISQQLKVKGLQLYQLFIEPGTLVLKFNDVYNRLLKIYLDEHYKNLFYKRRVVDLVNETKNMPNNTQLNSSKLQQLILKQEQIRKALTNLRRTKKIQ